MSLGTLLVCDDSVHSRLIKDLISGEKALARLETVNRDGARHAIEKLSPQIVWIELYPSPVHGLSLPDTVSNTLACFSGCFRLHLHTPWSLTGPLNTSEESKHRC